MDDAQSTGKRVVDLTTDDGSKDHTGSSTQTKRPKISTSKDSPIKLHATTSDQRARQAHSKDHSAWTQCLTLRELIQVDTKTIQWIVISNFMIQFDFLIDEVPELLSIPNVLVFYGEGDPSFWKALNDSADFVKLRPSDPPGITNPLKSKFDYGVHHSKIFLIGYTDGTCRVVVSTANLLVQDYTVKSQGAYVEDFARKVEKGSSDFEDTLVDYISSYGYTKAKNWFTRTESLPSLLSKYDFSTAQAVLIPSIPGYHKLFDESQYYGHFKLRKALAAHTQAKEGQTIVCQFSSIGSLSEKYLKEQIVVSMDSQLCRLRDKRPKVGVDHLRLVYPTASEIRDSIEGYIGGGTVPGNRKNVSKAFLKPLYRKWSSSKTTAECNPSWKSDHVPHIKTYFQSKGDELDWFCLTSHNLSKAAWGEIQNTRYGRRLFIRHWEMGVLLTPSTLGVDRILPYGLDAPVGSDTRTTTIPVPFPVNPEEYGEDDQPWAVDAHYSNVDRFGRNSSGF